MSNVFNCVDFGIIISLVQGYIEESVDHGMECNRLLNVPYVVDVCTNITKQKQTI